MEHIGEIIKQRRKKLGLTQDQLARKLGYTDRSTISRIESGNNDVSTAHFPLRGPLSNISFLSLRYSSISSTLHPSARASLKTVIAAAWLMLSWPCS